jgi:hypothetical protein
MDRIAHLLPALLLGLLLSHSSVAQTEGRLGIKAGVNSSGLTVNNSVNRTGFHGGLLYRSDPVPAFGYQVELLYSRRGADWRINLLGLFQQEAGVTLDYLDLPVMAVYRPMQALEVHGGAYLGYLLGSTYTASGTLLNEQGDLGRGNFRELDLGLLLGLAVNIGPVQLGGRYNFGLSRVSDSSAANFLLGNANNRSGQLFAAYILPYRR